MKWKPWPHVDQAPTPQGLACAQGIINLSEAGPLDGYSSKKTHPNQRLLTLPDNFERCKTTPIADTSAASEAVALARRLAAQATQLVDSY